LHGCHCLIHCCRQSLHSLLRNIHVNHVKVTAPQIKRHLSNYLQDYKRGSSILCLAQQANYPPYLFGRYIVEQVAQIQDGKKGLTQAMRNPLEELGSLDMIAPEYFASEEHHFKVKEGYVLKLC
jgi:hypothetical protein